jgi:hypothetical protein
MFVFLNFLPHIVKYSLLQLIYGVRPEKSYSDSVIISANLTYLQGVQEHDMLNFRLCHSWVLQGSTFHNIKLPVALVPYNGTNNPQVFNTWLHIFEGTMQ